MKHIKKATPLKESSSSQNIKPNTIKVHLSPTERRIVNYLIESPRISCDLERLACCRYAADNIQHIRQKGISIITEMVSYKRQDGKRVWIGKYRIAPESLTKARLSSSMK